MNDKEIDEALALAEHSLSSVLMERPAVPKVDPGVLHGIVDATVRQHLSAVPVIQGPPGLNGRTPQHDDIRPIVEEVVAKIKAPKGEKGEKGERGDKGHPGDKVRIVERITDPRRMSEPDGAFGIAMSGAMNNRNARV